MSSRWAALAVVAVGGALGSVLRYGLSLAVSGPMATVLTNVLGCLCIGVLMTAVTEHGLLRPFLGVGVLGGFTTFSTFVTDGLLLSGQPWLAAVYLIGTLACALVAVIAGAALGRALVARVAPVAREAE